VNVYQSAGLEALFVAIVAQCVRDYFHPAWMRGPDRRRAVTFLEEVGLIRDGVPDERLCCPCPSCRRKRGVA
jgi:hypothetical protein